MIEPTLIKEELGRFAAAKGERLAWLRKIHGDRDPMMVRWRHHSLKGDVRRHWDYDISVLTGKYMFYVYFGHKDMAVQYKLAWGGHLVR